MEFRQVVGQNELKNKLIQNVKAGRISHAQMFLNQQGFGALPLAIAYAQYINCEDKQENDACQKCSSCLKYNKLAHPDLHFVFPINSSADVKDATCAKYMENWRQFVLSNPYGELNDWLKFIDVENKQAIINVKEGQELINKLTLKNFEAPYKVIIIWLFETVNTQAANKLLKVLEEPPEKTVFILIVNDHETLLPTILSRVQVLKLHRPSVLDISQALVERYDVSPEKAENIAHISEGDVNLSIQMLEEELDNQELLNEFRNWMLMCYKKDVLGCIDWSDKISKEGRNKQKNLLVYALSLYRKSMLLHVLDANQIVFQEHEKDFMNKFYQFVHQDNILDLVELFSEAVYHLERNANSKMMFLDMSLKIIKLILKRPQTND
jgi:DNA polymerase III subunit delta'